MPELLSTYHTGLTMHFYLLLMKAWIGVFGTSPLAVKLPTVLTGIALPPLTFVLGRRWVGGSAAALAAVLMALSGPLAANAQMARVYPILTVAVLWSMHALLRALAGGGRRAFVEMAMANALALALSLNATVVLLVQGIFLVTQALRDRRLLGRPALAFALGFAASGVLAAAFYAAALTDILRESGKATGPFLHLATLSGTFARNHPALPVVMLALLVTGAVTAWRRGPAGRLLVVWALVPALFYFLQRLRYPDWAIARYLLVHAPAQMLLIGCGLSGLLRRLLPRVPTAGRLAVASALVAGAVFTSPGARSQLFQVVRPSGEALRRLSAIARPGDVVTYDFLPYKFLVELEPGLDGRTMQEVAAGEAGGGGGRLLILTFGEPRARARWREHFDLEEIDGPRYRHALYVLVSRDTDSHAVALREFLTGLVDAAAAGARLGLTPARHFAKLEEVHGMLAVLADREGRTAERDEHRALQAKYRKRAREEWERVV